MEREAVRSRMNIISGHFVAQIISEDIAAATTHLFPLNCSSNLSSPFTRLDNRLYFGRQASSAQGYFMRQATIPNEQGNPIQQSGVCSANYVNEEKPVASRPPCFSRPATLGPQFARPAQMEFKCSYNGIIEAPTRNEILPFPQAPKFARPRGASTEEKQLSSCKEQIFPSQIKGTEWSPRINVAESKSSHVITVELPGVDINDIRVEMDEKNIIVKGKRSMKLSKAASCSNDSFATYHRMEISQGPYQVVWPIPAGTNMDSVSAEFVEGMLQITVPKL